MTEDIQDWRTLVPKLSLDEKWDLHQAFQWELVRFKIPQRDRYDAVFFSYVMAKEFYGDKMTYGIFTDRLKACKPQKKQKIDYFEALKAVVESE